MYQEPAPTSPKFTVSAPDRAGQKDVKWGESEQEPHSFFAIYPSVDFNEDVDDYIKTRDVKFILTRRPPTTDEDGEIKKNQDRHIHSFGLYEEVLYSAVENIDLLSMPDALYAAISKHAHSYTNEEQYNKKVAAFLYNQIDDHLSDETSKYSEDTSRHQRAQAEKTDHKVLNYFEKKTQEIAKKYNCTMGEYIDYEKLEELLNSTDKLSEEEKEIINIEFDLKHRVSYLTSHDIRVNMKDSSYLKLCSNMNGLMSDAIEIINTMPGITFSYGGSAKGNGEAHALRWLRDQNCSDHAAQDIDKIAQNMNKLLDFPVVCFINNDKYDPHDILINHINLTQSAFPNIQMTTELISSFIKEFEKTKDETYYKKEKKAYDDEAKKTLNEEEKKALDKESKETLDERCILNWKSIGEGIDEDQIFFRLNTEPVKAPVLYSTPTKLSELKLSNDKEDSDSSHSH